MMTDRGKAALAPLVEHNQLLSRALGTIQAGRIDLAAQLLAEAPGQPLSLQEVFAVYHAEVEATMANLREGQLRTEQSLDWFAQLFRTLPVAALMLDSDANIQDANAVALDLLGLAPALRAVAVPLRRLFVATEDELKFAAALQRLRADDAHGLDDVPLRTLGGGKTLRVDVRLCELPPQPDIDESSRVLCVINDVTARHVAQQAEQARDRAEAASHAKTRLLSRISHELRTPLNAVIGFSHILLMPTSSLDESARHRVQMIQQAGSQLLALVNEVLDINAAETGRLTVALTPVNLAAAVAKVMPMHTMALQAAGLTLVMEGLPAEGRLVMADERRLREVLHNLVSNAIKYNRPGGTVRLRCVEEAGWVTLNVEDTGLGLAANQLEHLFEPFNRLGAERTTVSGSGLGLSIAHALMQAMGGSLAAVSEVGQGSTFSLRLRAA